MASAVMPCLTDGGIPVVLLMMTAAASAACTAVTGTVGILSRVSGSVVITDAILVFIDTGTFQAAGLTDTILVENMAGAALAVGCAATVLAVVIADAVLIGVGVVGAAAVSAGEGSCSAYCECENSGK